MTTTTKESAVPESKGRPKAQAKQAAAREEAARLARKPAPNPPWFVPVMCALMILGLLWVATFYVTQGDFPVGALGYWNLALGFALMLAGFFMTTRWR
jgi:hypothetical protein